MIGLADIAKSINEVLKKTGYKVYGNEVKEGFKRPSFFVQIIPINSETLKRDISENLLMVEVLYFNKDKTDLENLEMYDILKKNFTPSLQIFDRKILVRNFRAETIESDVYSMRFDLNFYDEIIDNTPATELMGDLKLKL